MDSVMVVAEKLMGAEQSAPLRALKTERDRCQHDMLAIKNNEVVECRWCGQVWR